MSGTVTILVDNRAEEPFISEHGFSVLLEIRGRKILFDTGQGGALFHNALQAEVSLSGLDALVLSHGHYDHGGNLGRIMALNPSIRFFAHPECLIPRWALQPGKPPRSIALSPEESSSIKDLPSTQLHWCTEPAEIMPDVWLTGSIPRRSSFEDVGGPFYQDEAGDTPDLIHDDMALWIAGESGLTVICGCCHSGVKNTIEYIASLSEDTPVKTLIGGLHLVNANNERLMSTVSFINETGIERVYPAHCTGETAMALLQEQLDAEVRTGTVGLQIKI
jgi:7,8-dihydropterin-6-yl-methyl-4-(beta-D-ribofuranosyl)aminobenzene 5'-phosphate synthase